MTGEQRNGLTTLAVSISMLPFRYSMTLSKFPARAARRKLFAPSVCMQREGCESVGEEVATAQTQQTKHWLHSWTGKQRSGGQGYLSGGGSGRIALSDHDAAEVWTAMSRRLRPAS